MTLYMMDAFGTMYAPVKRLKKQTIIERKTYGVQGWNADSGHEAGRLPGSGSFTFVGLHSVRRAVMQYLAQPEIDQVAVKTNQRKDVYRYFKQADGTITGYMSKNK